MGTLQNLKTLVLVVGAGASKEAGLPVGAELKRQIAITLDIRFDLEGRKLAGDDCIARALHQIATSEENIRNAVSRLLEASWRIRDAMAQAPSIDNFIDSHGEDERIAVCGKLAIARCILSAESKSKLHVIKNDIYSGINFEALGSTWFNAFFQLLTENCRRENLPARLRQVAIISFNYDRCIEHYLCYALQNYYGLAAEEAAKILASLEIYHPYGRVGALPWFDCAGGIDFGSTPTPAQLIALSKQLRTFTEGTDVGTSDVAVIRALLTSAERIAFLGFAFHPLNLKLLFSGLSSGTLIPTRQSVFATALGISKSDAKLIALDLNRMGGFGHKFIKINTNLTCAQLFAEYRRSMSL